MVKPEKITSPQKVLEELGKIKADIKAEELTPEGRAAILQQVKEIETLLLEMKEDFSKRNLQNGANA